jgi:Photosynthetic reaction centre cytochrome C subunit
MPFFKRKKSIVFFFLSVFIFIGILGSRKIPREETVYTNLKVLSKSMDEDKMETVMHSFNSQLGVTCIYCHILDNSSPPVADFATDVKPEKLIARKMLKMTIKLNRKYFGSQMDGKLDKPGKIWCETCHHGLPRPELPRKKAVN